jgi:rhodanese-related sulfurtransferase
MTAIEATNRGLADMDWAMLTSTDPVREVDQDALEARPPEAVLLDVREPQEFADGHVPGARNLPQAELANRLSEVPRDRPLYLICQGGFRSLRAAQFLSQMGFKDVASVTGGTEGWRAAKKPLSSSESGAQPQHFVESEWAHAGAFSYEI